MSRRKAAQTRDPVAEAVGKEPNGTPREADYVLKLYVTGTTPRASKAIVNTRKLCEEHLHGRYELRVIDILRDPMAAKSEQIVAAPTLIRERPLPLRRFIGDMSETERLLAGLDIA